MKIPLTSGLLRWIYWNCLLEKAEMIDTNIKIVAL